MTQDQFKLMLLKACAKEGQKNFARNIGVSAPFLNHVINGKKPPSKKILDHFGFSRQVIYVASEGVGS